MCSFHSLPKQNGSRQYESVDVALKKFLSHPAIASKPSVATEYASLTGSLDRVLAVDLECPLDIPPFSRATVDGFAVKAIDTKGASRKNPALLEVTGKIAAGDEMRCRVESKKVIEIATGAKIPEGADSVVMMEYIEVEKGQARIFKEVEKGAGITLKGEDLAKGHILLSKGTWLTPHDVGLIASVGVDKVPVCKKMKVAVFSTGNELADPSNKLGTATIFDSNRYMISCLVKNYGGESVDLGICKDNKHAIRAKLLEALQLDMVVISGGSSVGEKDFVPEIIDGIGEPGVIVRGVAIKPGSPTSLAIIDGTPIIVAPGFPVSAFVAFYTFGQPLLFQMLKTRGPPVARITAVMASTVKLFEGMRTLVRVRIVKQNGSFIAEPVSSAGAGLLSTLTKSDGIVVIEGKDMLFEGEEVQVILLRNIMS